MKYEILKTFKGSQDGRFSQEFQAGTVAELSEYLVGCIDPGWVRPVGGAAPALTPDNKAIVTDGARPGRRGGRAAQ